eukprot:758510_1
MKNPSWDVDVCDDGTGRNVCDDSGSNGGSDTTTTTTTTQAPNTSTGGDSCSEARVIDLDDNDDHPMSGMYAIKSDDINGKQSYYDGSKYYLYWDSQRNKWAIGTKEGELSNSNHWAYCTTALRILKANEYKLIQSDAYTRCIGDSTTTTTKEPTTTTTAEPITVNGCSSITIDGVTTSDSKEIDDTYSILSSKTNGKSGYE